MARLVYRRAGCLMLNLASGKASPHGAEEISAVAVKNGQWWRCRGRGHSPWCAGTDCLPPGTTDKGHAMDADKFKQGMRRLASGVSLITTVNNGERHGLVATAVSSVTATPPTLLICVNKTASAHDHIGEAGLFCVNILADGHEDVAARFSSARDRETRFSTGEWCEIETGAPALIGSLVSFDCEVRQTISYMSHTIYLAEIVGVELWAETVEPLVYFDGRYRLLEDDKLAKAS